MHLTSFKTPFGNNKAENQNLILAFSLTDRNIAIFVVRRILYKHFKGDFWTFFIRDKV